VFEKDAINALITQGLVSTQPRSKMLLASFQKNERLTLPRLLKKLRKHEAETRK